MKKTLALLLTLAVMLSANVGVSNIEILDLGDNLMDPVFSDDGNYLLYTSLDGGNIYNFDTKNITNFSIAAYDYSMDKSGNIRYRIDTFVDKRKTNSVKIYNLETKDTEILLDQKRLDIVPKIKDHGIYYVENKIVKAKHENASSISKPVALSYDGSLLLYSYGTSNIIKPSGDMYYLWPSVSPQNDRIVYVDMHDLIVSDLNGKIEFTVKEARAPKWSPDGKYIAFMRDLDDGHTFISSDIFVVRVEDRQVFQLTNTDDRMEMYPSWSADGNKITCEDAQNDVLLILTLEKQ